MPWVGFEPTISAGERPQTKALDRAATGNGITLNTVTVVFEAIFSPWHYNPHWGLYFTAL